MVTSPIFSRGLLTLCCLLVFGAPAFAQQELDFKALDVSRSMLQRHKFDAARADLVSQVASLSLGSHLVVISFGVTANLVFNAVLRTASDREAAIQAIRGLRATHDYTQFDELFKQIKLVCYEASRQYQGRVRVRITVLSDGIPSPYTGGSIETCVNLKGESVSFPSHSITRESALAIGPERIRDESLSKNGSEDQRS